jgi:hypothetical protein
VTGNLQANLWRRAAQIVVEDPKRASWALQDAFGTGHIVAWHTFLAVFDEVPRAEDAEPVLPFAWFEGDEYVTALCLMADICEEPL